MHSVWKGGEGQESIPNLWRESPLIVVVMLIGMLLITALDVGFVLLFACYGGTPGIIGAVAIVSWNATWKRR